MGKGQRDQPLIRLFLYLYERIFHVDLVKIAFRITLTQRQWNLYAISSTSSKFEMKHRSKGSKFLLDTDQDTVQGRNNIFKCKFISFPGITSQSINEKPG